MHENSENSENNSYPSLNRILILIVSLGLVALLIFVYTSDSFKLESKNSNNNLSIPKISDFFKSLSNSTDKLIIFNINTTIYSLNNEKIKFLKKVSDLDTSNPSFHISSDKKYAYYKLKDDNSQSSWEIIEIENPKSSEKYSVDIPVSGFFLNDNNINEIFYSNNSNQITFYNSTSDSYKYFDTKCPVGSVFVFIHHSKTKEGLNEFFYQCGDKIYKELVDVNKNLETECKRQEINVLTKNESAAFSPLESNIIYIDSKSIREEILIRTSTNDSLCINLKNNSINDAFQITFSQDGEQLFIIYEPNLSDENGAISIVTINYLNYLKTKNLTMETKIYSRPS